MQFQFFIENNNRQYYVRIHNSQLKLKGSLPTQTPPPPKKKYVLAHHSPDSADDYSEIGHGSVDENWSADHPPGPDTPMWSRRMRIVAGELAGPIKTDRQTVIQIQENN